MTQLYLKFMETAGFLLLFFFKKNGFFFYCSKFMLTFLLPRSATYFSIDATGTYSTWCVWLDQRSAWCVSDRGRSLLLWQEEGRMVSPPPLTAVSVGKLIYVFWIENKALAVSLGSDIVLFSVPIVIANSSSRDDSDSCHKRRRKNNTFSCEHL